MNLLAVAILLAVAFWLVMTFNRLVREKNLMREGWSGIEVQLKRRHDLIPNLVEAVKGYAGHERKLFEEIATLRSRCMSAENIKEKGEAEQTLSQAIKSLFAIAEAYPDLKASQNFLDLQKNLSEIEDQIQLARRYYNGTARNYNILVESFPSAFVAKIFNFTGADFFEAESALEREVPEVKF